MLQVSLFLSRISTCNDRVQCPLLSGKKTRQKDSPMGGLQDRKNGRGLEALSFLERGWCSADEIYARPWVSPKKTLFSSLSSEIQHRPLSVEQFSLIALKIGGVGSWKNRLSDNFTKSTKSSWIFCLLRLIYCVFLVVRWLVGFRKLFVGPKLTYYK